LIKELDKDLTHETLPIINKPKHPKKREKEYKEQNGRTHVEEDKRTTYEGKPQGGTSSSQTPSYCDKHIK
jgi:hypothetical protein